MSCFDNGLLIELKLELEMAMSSLKLLGHHTLLNVESVSIRRNQFFFNFSYFHFWPCLLLMAAVCEKANWKRVTKNDTLITETEWRVKDLVFFFSSVLCLVAQLYPILWDSMDYSPRLLCPWGFSRQEFWSGLPFPSPEDLLNSGIEPRSPALQADPLPSEPPGKRFSPQ